MQTKEELIHEMFSAGTGSYNPEDIGSLMESYAKQQSISFDKWKIEKGYHKYIYDKWHNNYPTIGYTTEELYAQFIESQNNNQ
jgi:hypothetical protein